MALYYLTYYRPDSLNNLELEISPAGQQKSGYLIEKLDKLGSGYVVISLAETNAKHGFHQTTESKLNCHGRFVLWKGFGKPNRIIRRLHYYYRRGQLKQFLSGLTSNDTVIAYHSLQTADIFYKYKRKKGFRFVLELEEIYQDVVNCGAKKAAWERKVITVADGYILAAEALSKEIPAGRPYIVANGTYHAEPERNVGFDDGKIHCVYAGTFDPTKGGAAAAAAAEFLPENYHVHILGFGSEKQVEDLEEQIRKVQKTAKCLITYDGLKSGEEYIQFLQKCHIGLCTQIPDAKYTETSFPSKILVYLANGLRVLSVRIPAVEQSAVGDILYYYDKQEPEEIAKAILSINTQDEYNSRERIQELDRKFQRDLSMLLEA